MQRTKPHFGIHPRNTGNTSTSRAASGLGSGYIITLGRRIFSGFPGYISEDPELEVLVGDNNPEDSTASLDLRTLVSPTGCISPTTDQCEPLPDLGLAELDEIDFPDFFSSSEEEQDPPSDDGSELDSDFVEELLGPEESSDDELWVISSDEELTPEIDNPLEWNGGTDEDYLD